MSNMEATPTIRCVTAIFYHLHIWQIDDEPSCRYSLRRVLYFVNYFLFIILIAAFAIRSDNIEERTFLAGITIGGVVIGVKVALILWKQPEILQFLYDPIVGHSSGGQEELVEMKNKMKNVDRFFSIYLAVIFLSFVTTLTLSLPMFSGRKTLPFFIVFESESEYGTILYCMAFVYLSMGCAFAMIFNSLMFILWYIMFNYSVEYKLLGNRLKRLSGPSYQQDLIASIQAHRNLSGTIERFRNFFSGLFLAELATGAISICVSIYNLLNITSDNLSQIFIYLGFLVYCVFDIFLIMFLADKITNESDRLSCCLFESGWIDQPQSTKKCVIIFGEMIRQPQQMIIWIYPMNLERFTLIVNSAYSMYNILKNLEK